MEMKKILTLVMCLGLLAGTSMGMPTIVKGEGAGSAGVANVAPTVTHEILDTSWTTATTVAPFLTTFYFNVSVTDVNGVVDIENTTFTMRYSTLPLQVDNPAYSYKFCYDETLAQEFLIYPITDDGYLVSFVRTVMSPTQVNYTFELRLNQTAKDTNGANEWKYYGSTTDLSAVTVSTSEKYYAMDPYISMNYWGNAGGMDFSWTGEPGSNQSAEFNTLVTSNDIYNLNCSYTGAFEAPWGAPTFWIQYDGWTPVQIPDVSATPGANATWITTASPYSYNRNLTHTIALEFPADISKITYTGVTIWIQVSND